MWCGWYCISISDTNVHLYKTLLRDPPPRNHDHYHSSRVGSGSSLLQVAGGRECPDLAISALTAVLKGSTRAPGAPLSVHRGDTSVARAVAPAPFDAKPDGPTCAAEMAAHQPRSGSLPRDQFDQYCEVRLAAKANDDTHKSMLSCLGSWLRGRSGARLSLTDDP